MKLAFPNFFVLLWKLENLSLPNLTKLHLIGTHALRLHKWIISYLDCNCQVSDQITVKELVKLLLIQLLLLHLLLLLLLLLLHLHLLNCFQVRWTTVLFIQVTLINSQIVVKSASDLSLSRNPMSYGKLPNFLSLAYPGILAKPSLKNPSKEAYFPCLQLVFSHTFNSFSK